MASTGGKKKSKVFFVIGSGMSNNSGDRKVPSTWNPGKSKHKFKKIKPA